jgi:hypothetical protein
MTFERKRLDVPDESRTFDHGTMAVVTVGETTVGRVTLQPGRQW